MEDRVYALDKELKLSKEKQAQLKTEVETLRAENLAYKLAVENTQKILDEYKGSTIPVDVFADKLKEISIDFEGRFYQLEGRIRDVEQKYKRTIVANTFAADCKCIGKSDNTLTLSIMPFTNEIKDENAEVVIFKERPLFQQTQIKIIVRRFEDEREDGVIVKTENGEDFITIDRFFVTG